MKFWKNLSKRERLWICLATIVILVGGIDRLILIPVTRKMAQLDADIANQKQELANCRHSLAAEPALHQELTKYTTYLKRIGSDEKETSKTLGLIENLATAAAVTLIDTKPRQAEDNGWYDKLTVEIEAEANPQQFVHFLYAINNAPDAMRVDKLQIAPKDRNSATLRASLIVSKMIGNEAADAIPER